MRRLATASVVLALSVAANLVGSPASAQPQDEERSVRTQLIQTGAALAESTAVVRTAQLAVTQARQLLPPVEAELTAARAATADAQARYERAAAATRTAELAADRASRSYRRAQQRVADAHATLDSFAASAYRAEIPASVTFVLGSRSLGDIATAMEVVHREGDDRAAAVRALTTAQHAAARAHTDAEARSRRARAARAESARLLDLQRATTARAQAAEQRISQLVAWRDAALKRAQAAHAAEQARYADLQAQSAAIAARLRSAAGRARAAGWRAPQPGHLGWPIRGVITSPFGYRFDPVFHTWRLHAGIDIAAPNGTPIGASAAGTVVNAGWAGGYGNYTCIDHGTVGGRDLATCYGHQSAILVRPGQPVSAGQVIGRVGSTGASTGNHLHFEVRLNGTPVDPLGWL